MPVYNIWFQEGHIMMMIKAKNNQEARRIFNQNISIKKAKEGENEDP